jgi:hypothetical protein
MNLIDSISTEVEDDKIKDNCKVIKYSSQSLLSSVMIFWFFQNWKNELKLDKAPFNALSLEEIEISAGVRAKEKDWNLILLSLMQSLLFYWWWNEIVSNC